MFKVSMASLTSQNIGSSSQTNGYTGAGGIYASVTATFQYFSINTNTLTVYTSATSSVNGSNPSTPTPNMQIWLNNVQVYDGATGANNVLPLTISGMPSSIRVTIYIQAGVTSQFASTTYDSGTVPINMVSSDFTFADFTGTSTAKVAVINLPITEIHRPLFFKIKGSINGQKLLVLTQDGTNIYDFTTPGAFITDNYGCLTIVSDGSQWYVANYYPSNRQGYVFRLNGGGGRPSDSNNTAFVNSNVLNVFRSDTSTRSGGDNYAILPAIGGNLNPAICIIAYVGSNVSSRGFGNALILCDQYIDGVFASSSSGGNYLIVTDGGNTKSTGIILITDNQTGWYIAGWMYGDTWNWTDPDGGYWSINEPNYQQTCIINSGISTGGTNRFYTLPTNVVSSPRFMIVKTTTVQLTGVRFSSYIQQSTPGTPPGQGGNTSTPNVINDSTYRLYYAGNQTNSCLWLMSQQRAGETINRYYPLIGYTPN
jgi:hypothetical protein